MYYSMLAFIESNESLTRALELARRKNVLSLTLVSEDDLPEIEAQVDMEVNTVLFGDFRPDDLDQTVLNEINTFLSNLFEINPKLKESFKWHDNDLTQFMTYPFADVAQHCLRTAIMMKNIKDIYKPDIVFADEYWRKYAELIDFDTTNRLKKFPLFIRKYHRKIMFLFWLIIGMNLRLLFPIFIGKLLKIGKKQTLSNKEILLIGTRRQNRYIYPLWNKIVEKCPETAELFFSSNISLEFINEIRASKTKGMLAAFVDLKDIPYLLIRYLNIVYNYIQSDICKPFDIVDGKANYYRLLLDRLILLTSPDALFFARIREKLERLHRLKSILFSVPAAWSTILSTLKKKNIKTVAATHGMVLSPLGYRSNFSFKITYTTLDSKVLSLYSDDEVYVSLKSTPLGLSHANIEESTAHLIEKLIRIYPKQRTNAKPALPNLFKRRHAAILVSSNIKPEIMWHFLNEGIAYFSSDKEKYSISYIVVKIHPNSNIKEFKGLLETIVKGESSLPVFLSKEVNVSILFKSSSFVVSMPSSIMLDLLRMNVPFSVFIKGTMVDNTLIMHFEKWMRFKSFDELESITKEDLANFPQVAESLRRLCWEHHDKTVVNLEGIANLLLD